jgi:hypothetical protein
MPTSGFIAQWTFWAKHVAARYTHTAHKHSCTKSGEQKQLPFYCTGIGLALFCRSDKSGMSIFLLLSWLGEWWHDNRQIHSAAVAHPN